MFLGEDCESHIHFRTIIFDILWWCVNRTSSVTWLVVWLYVNNKPMNNVRKKKQSEKLFRGTTCRRIQPIFSLFESWCNIVEYHFRLMDPHCEEPLTRFDTPKNNALEAGDSLWTQTEYRAGKLIGLPLHTPSLFILHVFHWGINGIARGSQLWWVINQTNCFLMQTWWEFNGYWVFYHHHPKQSLSFQSFKHRPRILEART